MPRPSIDAERVNFYAPIKGMKILRALAKKRSTTYSELIRTAIREYIIREAKKSRK